MSSFPCEGSAAGDEESEEAKSFLLLFPSTPMSAVVVARACLFGVHEDDPEAYKRIANDRVSSFAVMKVSSFLFEVEAGTI